MPKNVMKLVKPSPHRARNDFDLSHRHLFDANFGELIPATCIETVPGDTISFHASDLLRCIPMVTSPFLRAKQHLDVWFVPYTDLWKPFNEFITQKSQPLGSRELGHNYCPFASLEDLFHRPTNPIITTDVVGRTYSRARLLNMLGYGTTGPANVSPAVNLWRLLAYNYIWYNEYRQSYYDDGTRGLPSGINASHLFNVDDLECSTLAGANINGGSLSSVNPDVRLDAMCQMRYRTWKKDLFTGLLPSSQFGAVSTFGGYGNVLLREPNGVHWNTQAGVLGTDQSVTDVNRGEVFNATTNSALVRTSWLESYTSFDVLSLRRSEAVQIWRENALRAGNRVSDNLDAHYGVRPSEYRENRPVFLGSVSAPLNIQDINATSQTTASENNLLGDIAGKGLSSLDEKVFHFKSNDFGVIMVMFSMLPEAEYNALGIDRMNQLLDMEDYYVPEYQDLGLEGVSSLNWFTTGTNVARVVGYAPRYYGYKQKQDMVFNGFRTGNSFSPWASPKTDVSQVMATPPSAMPLSVLYVNPTLFDNNFVVGLSNSNQFLVDIYFDVDAVRPMSVVGLPFS